MIQQFENMELLEAELLTQIEHILKTQIISEGKAKILLSGGNTPKKLYAKLSKIDIDWKKVIVGLVDERFVDKESDLSNEKMIRNTLIQNKASNAQLIGMLYEDSYTKNLSVAKEKYKDFREADILLLGMGDDGHTASLFPNDPSSDKAAIEIDANLSNTNAPVEPIKRITLNKSFINESKNLFLMFSGQNKGLVFEKSIENGYPIRHFIPTVKAVYYALK